jgi:hypothetical protein
VAALLAACSASTAARAQDTKDAPPASATSKADEASQRFKSGVNFYKDKDFAAALIDFKRAYELVPNWVVLYNLGQTARELKDYAAALNAYEQYLREGGAKVPAARKKDVSTAIEELKHKVGRIKVTTPVAGAEIGIDDVVVGSTPLADPIVVNVGRRKVSASAPGYTPFQRMVDVASMEDASVAVDLAKIDTGPKIVDAPPPPPPPPPKPPPPLSAWITLGATGAVGLAAGITGLVALSAHSSLNTALNTFPGNASTISSDQSKTRALAAATDALGALTLAGAVATVVVFLVAPRTPVKASVGVSPTGLTVTGSF